MALTEIVAAVATSGVTVGSGIAWIWGQWKEFRTEIREELSECRNDREVSEKRRAALITVIELFWQAIERHAPEAPELKRGQKLMDEYKKIGFEKNGT